MSRSGGYKYYNIRCGSCIGKTLCGKPGRLNATTECAKNPRRTTRRYYLSAEEMEMLEGME